MTLAQPKVIVLDRDGVINEDSIEFIKSPEEWHAIPGSLEAIAQLYDAGFLLTVATNQSGVGRGLFSIDTLWDIHRKMLAEVYAAGGYIERIFFCLHTPEDNCDCRKPKPGLLYQVAERFACGFENMIMIGDSARDLEAAQVVGARPILVRTGKGVLTEAELDRDTSQEVYDDLASAAASLINEANSYS